MPDLTEYGNFLFSEIDEFGNRRIDHMTGFGLIGFISFRRILTDYCNLQVKLRKKIGLPKKEEININERFIRNLSRIITNIEQELEELAKILLKLNEPSISMDIK